VEERKYKIKVREPQNPSEGEFTLCNNGELVVFRKGKWIIPNENK